MVQKGLSEDLKSREEYFRLKEWQQQRLLKPENIQYVWGSMKGVSMAGLGLVSQGFIDPGKKLWNLFWETLQAMGGLSVGERL